MQGPAVKLTELEPRWIEKDGRRVGFVFRSPTDQRCWQTVTAEPVPRREQWALIKEAADSANFQSANPDFAWTIEGGIEGADFETLTVTPSVDGSAGGLWHGFITNGEIR
jgi:hypothetical protein